MKTRLKVLSMLSLGAVLLSLHTVRASDHDDGETATKGRNVNLTDLFVFREDWHTGNAADNGNLILIMNSNPRSLPQQQYYFATPARYEFHIKRQTDKTVAYSSGEDATLRFEFAAPDATAHTQAITVTGIVDGNSYVATTTTGGSTILTTPLPGTTNTSNAITLNGTAVTVFAGLKEDPFFFDVQQYFKVRAGIASSNGTNLGPGFLPSNKAQDFAAGYNVNGIVVRVPISFLAGSSGATVFDVWETISIPQA